MSFTEDRNGFVTWKAFLLLLGSSITISIVTNWALLLDHASHPHNDAVGYREFERLDDRVRENHKEIMGELRKIRDQLK